jgi:hypothetical protein
VFESKVLRKNLHQRMMMEAVQTSETMVNSYQSTRRHDPEDGHLQIHRRENLKSNEDELIDLYS